MKLLITPRSDFPKGRGRLQNEEIAEREDPQSLNPVRISIQASWNPPFSDSEGKALLSQIFSFLIL